VKEKLESRETGAAHRNGILGIRDNDLNGANGSELQKSYIESGPFPPYSGISLSLGWDLNNFIEFLFLSQQSTISTTSFNFNRSRVRMFVGC